MTAPKKILIVDDDQSILEVITMILELEGFEVCGLDNGRSVFSFVRETKPDIVLLDIQLGDHDGRDICRELKRKPETKHIPIIMVSANTDWNGIHEKECEADDFISKPFEISELVGHVRRFAA